MKTVWILITVFLVGCTIAQPHVTEYTLVPKVDTKDYTSKLCKEKSLKVGQVFSSNSLMSHNMKYMQGEFEEATFTQSQWARTPNRAISDELVKSIRKSSLFKNISSYKSRTKTDLILETNVETFMQYFTQSNEKSYVGVAITFNLLNTKDSKSISHTTFHARVQTKSADAKGGVVALNSALSEVFLQTNDWLDGVCR